MIKKIKIVANILKESCFIINIIDTMTSSLYSSQLKRGSWNCFQFNHTVLEIFNLRLDGMQSNIKIKFNMQIFDLGMSGFIGDVKYFLFPHN